MRRKAWVYRKKWGRTFPVGVGALDDPLPLQHKRTVEDAGPYRCVHPPQHASPRP